MNKQKKDNIFIQHNMYEGKHSKSVYKGFKTCMFILVSLCFVGWINYKKLLLFEQGYTSQSPLYWLYKHTGINTLKIVFIILCIAIILLGIWDIKRLKSLRKKIKE